MRIGAFTRRGCVVNLFLSVCIRSSLDQRSLSLVKLMRRWFQRHHRVSTLAVSLLILALLPTPWPKVEFHNVRHQDEAGQVCEFHDHLLRWHPDAPSGVEVAVLHWHWGWPPRVDDSTEHPDDTPRLIGHLPDVALPTAEPTPAILVDTPAHSQVATGFEPPCRFSAFERPTPDPLAFGSGRSDALTFSASFAPRTSLTSRLHRWSC